MEFKQCLKEKASFVEKVLKEYMPKEEGYQKTVIEAMNYSLSAGGKRLRPILTLEACKIVGGNEDEAIPFAIAIEMIHTYSLIHDDLPALDNDDLRRGRPTNHKVYGEAMGILAGDALLNYAFEVMLAGSINKENPEKYLNAINEIAKGAGIYGMIGGQVVDVESENKQIEKEKLDYIHMNKTAAMMVGCMRAGATIGGANFEQMEEITKYAKNIGLSFQIVDDILDIVGDEAKLGKKVGSDIENHKSTYPSLLGLDKSKEIAHNLIDEAKKSIEKLSDGVDFLKGLAEYIIDREY
ncbi:polyprenyl synthetase family protein [Clostridioides difficile]|nr:polyprenyl synthetase family protein [Clostridioides difficile]HBF0842041.1 polyprenyl synthetase family protein [Clostridioides difficile]